MRPLRWPALVALSLLVLGPAGGWAHERPGMGFRPHPGPSRPIARPHPHRKALPHHKVVPCCLGSVYLPPAPPAVIVAPPPTLYVVVPSPPSLFYVPTPRIEPAPEITLPTGRWARHGNGVEYPYVWVWVGPAPR